MRRTLKAVIGGKTRGVDITVVKRRVEGSGGWKLMKSRVASRKTYKLMTRLAGGAITLMGFLLHLLLCAST